MGPKSLAKVLFNTLGKAPAVWRPRGSCCRVHKCDYSSSNSNTTGTGNSHGSAEDALSAICEESMRHERRHFLSRPEGESVPVIGRVSAPYVLYSHHMRRLVDFSSLDHLGFQSDADILSTYNKTLVENSLTDNPDYYKNLKSRLESEIARFHGRPAALVYNHVTDVLGKLLRALNGADDVILYDEGNENAEFEMALCIAETVPYRHLDMKDLSSKLQALKHKRHKMVLTNCVFPYSGDSINISEVAAITSEHNCIFVIDDTYGVGCTGPSLRGTEEILGAEDKPFLLLKSLENGIGLGTGGYMVGPESLIRHVSGLDVIADYLRLPAPILAATQLMFEKLGHTETVEIAHKTLDSAQHLRQNLKTSGFDVDDNEHPVVSVRVGQESLASTLADQLEDGGLCCYVAKYPEVPIGEARMCLSVTRHHTRDHIHQALNTFIKTGKRLKIPTTDSGSSEFRPR